jgi:peptide/nickel transport system ATP-binding protein
MAVLTVTDLAVELMTPRGVIRAVDGVSFDIDAGETVTIIGESGSGKSTTAMALLRLLPDDLAVISGSAQIDGQDVVGTRKHIGGIRGRSVALIPQDPMTALNPIATIGQQMVEAIRHAHGSLSKAQAKERALDLLRQVHLSAPERRIKSYPHELSGGMLQRVLIAMALSTEPRLIVADEPTSALDVTVQAGILDLLLEMQERTGVAVLLITHDLGVARLMSDRIHVMHRGRFVEDGDVEQVVDNPQHDYTRNLLAAIPELGAWDDPEDPDHPDYIDPVAETAETAGDATGTTPGTPPEPAGIPATKGGPRP